MRETVSCYRYLVVAFACYSYLTTTTSQLASATVLFKPYSLSFHDLPAKFALAINSTGICGALHVADPPHACSPLRHRFETGGEVRIALVVRGECSFDDKIRNAQRSGFQAVIVYDDRVKGNLVYMMVDPEGIKVHAVFVSNQAGEVLKEAARGEAGECCIYQAHSETAWTVLAISLISLFVILAFLALAVITHREWLYWQRINFPGRNIVDAKMVEALPRFTFTSASSFQCHGRETCAICLEDYKEGEDLKVLPCQHEFHSNCVGSWLTKWGTSCPVCKKEVKARFSFSDIKRGIRFQNQ